LNEPLIRTDDIIDVVADGVAEFGENDDGQR
jgi:hypothetical protein